MMNSDTIPETEQTEIRDEPVVMATCARCANEIEASLCCVVRETRLLCADCQAIECWDCGADTPDVMRRALAGDGPSVSLCTPCCASRPGRDWMHKPEAERVEQLEVARTAWRQLRQRWAERDRASRGSATTEPPPFDAEVVAG